MGQAGVHLGHADGGAAAAAVRPRRGANPRVGTPNLQARRHVQQGNQEYKLTNQVKEDAFSLKCCDGSRA